MRPARRVAVAGVAALGLAAAPVTARADAPADSADAAFDAWLSRLSAAEDARVEAFAGSPDAVAADSLFAGWLRTGEAAPAEPAGSARRVAIESGLASLRYDRVGGANLTVEGAAAATVPGRPELFARTGWAWAAHEATGRGGLRLRGRAAGGSWNAAGTWGREMVSYGSGGMPGNTIAALVAAEDWADYLREEGWRADVSWRRGPVRVGGGWSALRQTSLRTRADFALLAEASDFRANPRIDAGRLRRAGVEAIVGDVERGTAQGTLRFATAGRGLGGDFSYDAFDAELAARRRLPFGDEVRVRLGGGVVSEAAPLQALPFAGGTRVLRGYGINEFAAPRLAHLSVDWTLGTNLLKALPGLGRLRLQFAPFADAAALFAVRGPNAVVESPERPRWRFSTGLGIQHNLLGIPGRAGQIRVDAARRLDRAEDAWTLRAGLTTSR